MQRSPESLEVVEKSRSFKRLSVRNADKEEAIKGAARDLKTDSFTSFIFAILMRDIQYEAA